MKEILYRPFFYKLYESQSCDCSKCEKKESCAKRKAKEDFGQMDMYPGPIDITGPLDEEEMNEMSQDFCNQKSAKAGDGTKYTYKNGTCEITHCPTGKILNKSSGRCIDMPKK